MIYCRSSTFKRIGSANLSISRRMLSSEGGNAERKNIWTMYNNSLKKNPLLVKCLTSGILSFIADIVCQFGFSKTEHKETIHNLDGARAAKFTFLGTAFTAPALHFWYGWLGNKIPGVTFLSVITRLLLDQFIFAPCFLTSFFSLALLLDGTPEKIVDKIRNDLLQTVRANYIVWVPCQFINFLLVPAHLQVLFANSVGFFWNIYLSYSTFKSAADGNA